MSMLRERQRTILRQMRRVGKLNQKYPREMMELAAKNGKEMERGSDRLADHVTIHDVVPAVELAVTSTILMSNITSAFTLNL
jgi:hypothetical protein